jgi:restriction system protein
MKKYNLDSPWNPAYPAEVTPQEYEKQVVAWLGSSGASLKQFKVTHLEYLSGPGGEYEFDAVAEFSVLNGAQIIILVECKRYGRPVEREHVLALWAKLQDVSAHKAMIFSTCGFQSGALEYAKSKNIATITFVRGDFLYETKATGPTPAPPPWAQIPKFAGILTSYEDGRVHCTTLNQEYISLLSISGMGHFLNRTLWHNQAALASSLWA